MIETHGKTIHLFMKYRGISFMGGGTYQEHLNLLKEFGQVWWGNYGRVINQDIKRVMLNQIMNKIPTFCYLYDNFFNGELKKSNWIRGDVIDITNDYPVDNLLIPNYYRKKICSSYIKFNNFTVLDVEKKPRKIHNSLIYVYFDGDQDVNNLTVLSNNRSLFN